MLKTAAVAMSGGVDSSLTAALLIERGFRVIGLTMQLTEDSTAANDARRVADCLNIEHHVIDLRADFKNHVVDYFIRDYLNGRTPNPCVECNKYIKFGALYERAMELGADYFSTGHYARIELIDGRHQLMKGVNLRKDQSYVLYNLRADQLPKILLPLGSQSKERTRELAAQLKIPVADKPDSQEICFVPDDDYKAFLQLNAPQSKALESGDIVDLDGKILGQHKGAAFYTAGQRKGLGIAAPEALYVVRTDVERRRVIVGHSNDLFSSALIADRVHWIYPIDLPRRAEAKIRYGPRISQCTVEEFDGKIKITFDEPQRAITRGQSIVFYEGDCVLGGGIIDVLY